MSGLHHRSQRGTRSVCALLLMLVLAAISAHVQAGYLAAGRFHELWVKDDGTLAAWGYNAAGQVGDGSYIDRSFPVSVPGLTGVQAAAGGVFHSLALKTDGTVWAWGANGSGQIGDGTNYWRVLPVRVSSLTGVARIAAGSDHSLALKSDGTVWAWGKNDSGQLGDGTTTGRIVPVRVSGLTGVVAIAGGSTHSIALKGDGTVWTWGGNVTGQLGDGTTTARSLPAQVAGLTGVVGISTTYDHNVVLKADGSVWTWGYNEYGQLGDGTTVSRSLPVRVMGVVGVAQVIAGGFATYAHKHDGTVAVWGDNYYGQLGDGTTTQRNTPVIMQGLTGAALVTAGASHAAILRADGSVWSVGQNVIGQLGDGSLVQAPAPVELSGLTSVARLAGGNRHSLALKTNGTVVAWGDNTGGQLGDGTYVSRGAPTPVSGLTGVSAIAAGLYFSVALKADGTVWTWGDNANGELGNATFTARATAGQVPGLTGVVAIAAGYYHALALKADGSVWAWGGNSYGQLGDGTTTNRNAPTRVLSVSAAAIAAGSYHSLGLRSDGTVAAWGRNDYGQVGDGTNSSRPTPVLVTGLSGVTAIAGGAWHSLALKSGGTVWGWGYNGNGSLGVGTYQSSSLPVQAIGAAGVVAIAAGLHSLGLTSAGTVLAWGAGGMIGDGTDRDGLYPAALSFIGAVDRLAAGFDFTLALTRAGTVMGWGSNFSQKLGIAFPVESSTIVKVRDPQGAFAGSDLVVEFFNPTIRNGAGTPGIGHYFITAVPAEAVSIDSGGSGPGWQRTGRTFRAWRSQAKAPAGAVPVYRFYAREPNSHFYTASAAEYQSLRNQNPANDPRAGWAFEEISFYTMLPVGTGCAAGYYPVYRSYNSRFSPNPALNDGNHRLTPSVIDWLRSIYFLGYADEGVAFCAPVSSESIADLQAWYIYPGTEVQSGAEVKALFVFANNGPGKGDGGLVYIALPPEVTNWSLCFNSTTNCSAATAADLTALRSGLPINPWSAGGALSVLVSGTAPQLTAGSNATLKFAAFATNSSGTPDANRANNAPPTARTLVKGPQVCSYAVNPTSLSLGTAAQGAQIAVVAGTGCAWTLQNSVPWLTASTASGAGNGTVTLTPQANTVATARTGTLTIAGQTVTVTQAGVPCMYTAIPASLNLTATAQTAQVELGAGTGCNWTARTSAPWLTVTPATGTAGATLTVGVSANNTVANSRTGAITIGGLTIPVAQAGAVEVPAPPPPPVDPCAGIRLQRDGDQMPANGLSGESSVAVLADSVCRWSSQSTVPWLTVTGGGSATGNGTLTYAVQANPDPQLRIGSITVAGKAFTVTQQGSDVSSTHNGGSDSGGDSSGGGGGDSGGSSGGDSGGDSG